MKKGRIIIASILGILIIIVIVLLLLKPYVLKLGNDQPGQEENTESKTEEKVNKGTILLGINVLYDGKGIVYDENQNTITINAGGQYTISGNFINGQIIIATMEDVKLIMQGINIENPENIPLNITSNNHVTLELEKNCTNEIKGLEGISAIGMLDIQGSGSLKITSDGNGITASKITLNDGNLVVASGNAPFSTEIIINGGELWASGKGENNLVAADSTQKSIQVNFKEAWALDDEFSWQDENNNAIFTSTIAKAANLFLYSSSYLNEGNYYLFKNQEKITFNNSDTFTIQNNLNYFAENA